MTFSKKKLVLDQILAYTLAAGLFVQLSGRLWLPDNYATVTYLLFFIPSIIAFIQWRSDFLELISRIDNFLLFSLTALFIWIALSTLWSTPHDDQIENFVYSAKILLFIFIYILSIALLYKRDLKFLNIAILSSLAVLTVASTITVIYYFIVLDYPIRFHNRIHSIGYGSWNLQLNSVVAAIYYGSFTVVAFILSTNKQFSRVTRALILIGGFICLVFTFLTWTRTAAVGLAGAAIAYTWWQYGWRRTGLLLSSIALGIAVLAATMPWFEQYIYRSGFGSWRPEIWLATWEASLDNIAFGTGFNTDSHLTVSRTVENKVQTIVVPHAHNFYLQIFYWSGAVGVLLYLAVLLRAIQLTWRTKHDFYCLLSFVSLLYFCVVQTFDVYSIFVRPSYYWACIWLPMGILLGCSSKQEYP
jgi:O-antigen ligase